MAVLTKSQIRKITPMPIISKKNSKTLKTLYNLKAPVVLPRMSNVK